MGSYFVLSTLSWNAPFTVSYLQWQLLVGLVEQVELRDVNLKVLHCSALDWLKWLLEYSVHEDLAQCRYAAGELDHLLAELLTSSHNSLNSLRRYKLAIVSTTSSVCIAYLLLLSECEKREFGTLISRVQDCCSEDHFGCVLWCKVLALILGRKID